MTSCAKSLRLIATASLGASIALLGACSSGNVKETLGINRVAPDEFRVVSRPPLTVPPQFNLLPPSIEADAPGQTPASDAARNMVLGGQAPVDNLGGGPAADTAVAPVASKNVGAASKTPAGTSAADESFLKQAGTTSADPSIRKQLVEERVTKQITQEEESWWDKMSIVPKKSDPTVDPSKEAERIRENEDTGKPANEGETAIVKPTDRGVLGRILGDE